MNKYSKTVLYILISALCLISIVSLILSFLPFAENINKGALKLTDITYVSLPVIGILIMILVIDSRSQRRGVSKTTEK